MSVVSTHGVSCAATITQATPFDYCAGSMSEQFVLSRIQCCKLLKIRKMHRKEKFLPQADEYRPQLGVASDEESTRA